MGWEYDPLDHRKAADPNVIYKARIATKLPSLNEYINSCRANRYEGAAMKKYCQARIFFYIEDLPYFDFPIWINFHWTEANHRRDLDNVCFAKKFILDALVTYGKISDDNRKHVSGFRDTFGYGDDFAVDLEIFKAPERGGQDAE